MRQDLTSAEGNTSKADWSIPVRLVANENPGRVTVSLPVVTESVMSLPLCIVGQTKHGVSYFVIKEDKSPSCLLYNYTNVPIVYGYQNLSISRAGKINKYLANCNIRCIFTFVTNCRHIHNFPLISYSDLFQLKIVMSQYKIMSFI